MHQVIIIDSNWHRARELETLLNFMGESTRLLEPVDCSRQLIGLAATGAVLLGRDQDDRWLLPLAYRLRQDAADLPLVVVEEPDHLTADLPRELAELDCLRLARPFRRPSLARLLARLEQRRQGALVSLDPTATGAGNGLPELPPDGLDLKGFLNEVEYRLIRTALEESHGVVAHAAARLKLRRTTLVEKMRRYGL